MNLKRLGFLVGIAITSSVSSAQERGPSGQIYRELLPFVGMDGLHFELHGFGTGIWNIPGPIPPDPEAALTGLSHAEHERISKEIRADVAEAFHSAGIRLLDGPGNSGDHEPSLVADVSWYEITPDTISVSISVSVIESARLMKKPSTIVQARTWVVSSRTFTTKPKLPAALRRGVNGYVNEFIGLYARAHAKPR